MDREKALKMVNDMFIKPKMEYYGHQIIISYAESDYRKQLYENIETMNKLQIYLEENLK